MKFLNILEKLLNCLKLAADLWDWVEKHMPFFEAFMTFLS